MKESPVTSSLFLSFTLTICFLYLEREEKREIKYPFLDPLLPLPTHRCIACMEIRRERRRRRRRERESRVLLWEEKREKNNNKIS